MADEYQLGLPVLTICKLATVALSDTKKDCAFAIGATGVAGCVSIVTLDEFEDIHPLASVTVKVYIPEFNPEMVVLIPVEVKFTFPGNLVIVQLPEGNPLNVTLPVATEQVGCIIMPTIGAVTDGAAFITTFDEADELQIPLETVNVYVPAVKLVTV
jgi:hypothetical protein